MCLSMQFTKSRLLLAETYKHKIHFEDSRNNLKVITTSPSPGQPMWMVLQFGSNVISPSFPAIQIFQFGHRPKPTIPPSPIHLLATIGRLGKGKHLGFIKEKTPGSTIKNVPTVVVFLTYKVTIKLCLWISSLAQLCFFIQSITQNKSSLYCQWSSGWHKLHNPASQTVRIFPIYEEFWGFLWSQRVKVRPAVGGEKAVLSPQSSILSPPKCPKTMFLLPKTWFTAF